MCKEFKVGDLVKLKSGGPSMTVVKAGKGTRPYEDERFMITVSWWGARESLGMNISSNVIEGVQQHSFPPECLIHA